MAYRLSGHRLIGLAIVAYRLSGLRLIRLAIVAYRLSGHRLIASLAIVAYRLAVVGLSVSQFASLVDNTKTV